MDRGVDPPRPTERRIALFWGIPICLSLLVLLFSMLCALGVDEVWDDAYMFTRYADNFLKTGVLSWNPGGEPTFGLTSNLYLLVVLPVRAVLSGNPAVAVQCSSLLCGLAFLPLAALLVLRSAPGNRALQGLSLLLVLVVLAGSSRQFADHCTSGMDTCFALSAFSIFLLVCHRHDRKPTWLTAVAVGVCGGLAFFARPDLLIFAVAMPASLALFAPSPEARRKALAAGGLAALTVGAQVAVAWAYFRSPLPLSFYCKAQNAYGEFFAKQYEGLALHELFGFLLSYGSFAVLGLVGLALVRMSGELRGLPVPKGLVLGTAVFVLYHTFFVLQVMHFDQRFYYPALPALICLGAWGLSVAARSLPSEERQFFQKRQGAAWAVLCLLLVTQLCPLALIRASELWMAVRSGRFADFDLQGNFDRSGKKAWFGLDAFSTLPDDLVIATTEVGLPAALNPGKTIVDLAGLNEGEFARHGFSADRLFQQYAPDLLYLPHPHYLEMREAIGTHPSFVSRYEFYSDQVLMALGCLAIRRDSPHYQALRQMIAESLPISAPPPQGCPVSP